MRECDISRIPLEGTHLVEANAGTGKTYALSSLFLRLILEKGLSPGQILVVTYTRAATQELRGRIRDMIRQGIDFLTVSAPVGPGVELLLRGQRDRVRAVESLTQALRDFDEAAIYTIHGFCQRLVEDQAFETGSLFDVELTTSEQELEKEIVEDFWRNHITTAEPELVHYLVSRRWDPGNLLRSLSPGLKHPDIHVIPTAKDQGLYALAPYRKTLADIRELWPEVRDRVRYMLMDPGIKGNTYGVTTARNGGRSPRALKVDAIVAAMDQFLAVSHPPFPPIPEIEKLSARKLAVSMKKGYSPPEHRLFDFCARLWQQKDPLTEEMNELMTMLKARLFQYIRDERPKRKALRNMRGYQDLLTESLLALKRRGKEKLISAVRSNYRAALIDEFQDTDQVQYDIFNTIFGKGNTPLFYIGDPKQAIYGFRGADVVTYMAAARAVPDRCTLRVNWRSHADLVKAVNTVFSGIERPFVYREIEYTPSKPTGEKKTDALQVEDGSGAPLRICLLRHPEGQNTSVPLPKKRAWPLIVQYVAREVARLVDMGRSGKAFLGDRPLLERDIAVLVRKNREARLIQDSLRMVDIPSVLYNAGDIFETKEAAELALILQAIAEPGKEGHMRAALATETMGEDGETLEALSLREDDWERRILDFREYQAIWEKQGFVSMFRQLLMREKVRARVLAFPDGERKLTNILHLGELLHGAALEERLGMHGLVSWLFRKIEDHSHGVDEQLLRLETDEEAVRIVTIHKSKGLEYPVVFCPSLWDGGRDTGNEVIYHDPDNDSRLTMDLGSGGREQHETLAREESLAENLRLLYVALTRAQYRCYVVWGLITDAERSALAYVLHGRHGADEERPANGSREVPVSLDRETVLKDLMDLEKDSGGTIAVEGLRKEGSQRSARVASEPLSLQGSWFRGKIPTDWRISSFSSLSSGQKLDAEMPDYDSSFFREASEDPEVGEAELETVSSILTFPKGARAGTCLHDILEHIDFTEEETSGTRYLIAEKLRGYGFEDTWTGTIHEMVQKVTSVHLDPDDPELVLRKVSTKDRLNELEFVFPLKRITRDTLREFFAAHTIFDLGDNPPEEIGRVSFSPVRGFLKGFMDLVFHFRGKFYLVDWKSNFLGYRVEDYGQDGLKEAMAKGYYYLQYHLYTLALDQYLKIRISDYRYEDFFGGIFYLFLRGVDPARGPDFGVFRDKPSADLINAMRETLIG